MKLLVAILLVWCLPSCVTREERVLRGVAKVLRAKAGTGVVRVPRVLLTEPTKVGTPTVSRN